MYTSVYLGAPYAFNDISVTLKKKKEKKEIISCKLKMRYFKKAKYFYVFNACIHFLIH
jgi:hypothetical protein